MDATIYHDTGYLPYTIYHGTGYLLYTFDQYEGQKIPAGFLPQVFSHSAYTLYS